jgi:hypothetical protein
MDQKLPKVRADGGGVVGKKPGARSRMPNANSLLPKQDGRTVWARIMRDTLATLIAHCGGDNFISDTRRLVARRVAALEAELIFAEDKFAQARADGAEPSPDMLDLYGRLADRQRRLADALGWDRDKNAKDITPSLQDYLRSKTIDHDDDPPRGNGKGHHRVRQ